MKTTSIITVIDRQFLASEARRLADEPLLKQALAAMESTTIDSLMHCDEAERAELIITLRVLRGFQSNLRSLIAEGSQPKRGGVA